MQFTLFKSKEDRVSIKLCVNRRDVMLGSLWQNFWTKFGRRVLMKVLTLIANALLSQDNINRHIKLHMAIIPGSVLMLCSKSFIHTPWRYARFLTHRVFTVSRWYGRFCWRFTVIGASQLISLVTSDVSDIRFQVRFQLASRFQFRPKCWMEPHIATGYFTYLTNIDVGKFTYLLVTCNKKTSCWDLGQRLK